MTPTKKSVHARAGAALVIALIAAGFALYGSFLSEVHIPDSPLNLARRGAGLESVRASEAARFWLPVAAYFAPFLLGMGAALMGGWAMRRIEGREENYSGNWYAVFAIMIGGLSAVVSGCMILVIYGWKYVPTAYTY